MAGFGLTDVRLSYDGCLYPCDLRSRIAADLLCCVQVPYAIRLRDVEDIFRGIFHVSRPRDYMMMLPGEHLHLTLLLLETDIDFVVDSQFDK